MSQPCDDTNTDVGNSMFKIFCGVLRTYLPYLDTWAGNRFKCMTWNVPPTDAQIAIELLHICRLGGGLLYGTDQATVRQCVLQAIHYDGTNPEGYLLLGLIGGSESYSRKFCFERYALSATYRNGLDGGTRAFAWYCLAMVLMMEKREVNATTHTNAITPFASVNNVSYTAEKCVAKGHQLREACAPGKGAVKLFEDLLDFYTKHWQACATHLSTD